jgi:hypothetical protein
MLLLLSLRPLRKPLRPLRLEKKLNRKERKGRVLQAYCWCQKKNLLQLMIQKNQNSKFKKIS